MGLKVCWPVRPEKTCSEERRSYVRQTKQREAVCVTIDSYIQAGIFCDVLFCAGQCTDLTDIVIICVFFVFNKLLFFYIYC